MHGPLNAKLTLAWQYQWRLLQMEVCALGAGGVILLVFELGVAQWHGLRAFVAVGCGPCSVFKLYPSIRLTSVQASWRRAIKKLDGQYSE